MSHLPSDFSIAVIHTHSFCPSEASSGLFLFPPLNLLGFFSPKYFPESPYIFLIVAVLPFCLFYLSIVSLWYHKWIELLGGGGIWLPFSFCNRISISWPEACLCWNIWSQLLALCFLSLPLSCRRFPTPFSHGQQQYSKYSICRSWHWAEPEGPWAFFKWRGPQVCQVWRIWVLCWAQSVKAVLTSLASRDFSFIFFQKAILLPLPWLYISHKLLQ